LKVEVEGDGEARWPVYKPGKENAMTHQGSQKHIKQTGPNQSRDKRVRRLVILAFAAPLF